MSNVSPSNPVPNHARESEGLVSSQIPAFAGMTGIYETASSRIGGLQTWQTVDF